ncbi:MAG: SecDF P1 head subdomain-containing protein [Planctomycetota bacterium]
MPVHPKNRKAFEGYVAANEAVSRTPETENGNILEILVLEDEFDVTEKFVEVAQQAVDEELNPCIHVLLSKEGARRLALLTSRHPPDSAEAPHHKLAFIFDGRLRVAHNFESHLRHQFRITGLSCGKKQVRELAWALYTGALPIPICKAEEKLVADNNVN